MTPEQLKSGRELADEIEEVFNQLKQLEDWREQGISNRPHYRGISFKLIHSSMEILNNRKDPELVDTVLTMAVSRLSARLEALKKEFETL